MCSKCEILFTTLPSVLRDDDVIVFANCFDTFVRGVFIRDRVITFRADERRAHCDREHACSVIFNYRSRRSLKYLIRISSASRHH